MTISAFSADPDVSVETFLDLARSRLSKEPSSLIFDTRTERAVSETEADGDPELAQDLMLGKALRRAAVLVPVVAHPQPTILLTQRTEHLPSHAGQVAFPGGKLEPGETDPVEAALREAWEEIGLEARHIRPVGFLDAMRTHTGFHVDPVVAIVEPGFDLTLDASEVADAFEVPLSFLMDERNHQRKSRIRDGRQREFYAMPYGERYIWGVTASMLKNMHIRLFGA